MTSLNTAKAGTTEYMMDFYTARFHSFTNHTRLYGAIDQLIKYNNLPFHLSINQTI